LQAHLKDRGVVCLFGETPANQRQNIIDTFVEDPSCQVIVLQHKSGGAGIDNLQTVCNDALMVELPYRAAHLLQAVSRLHRDGQKQAVNCRLAIAEKTLQVRLWECVQDNDSLVNMIVRGAKDIRDALMGL
ncbi:MAG: C-terminal helicase domain-containing protein, partial [Candidatus Paceibacterota bacterium]